MYKLTRKEGKNMGGKEAKMKDTGRLVNVQTAANFLEVSPQTIYSWIYHKKIEAINLTSKQKRQRALWRIPLSAIEEILGVPICPKAYPQED